MTARQRIVPPFTGLALGCGALAAGLAWAGPLSAALGSGPEAVAGSAAFAAFGQPLAVAGGGFAVAGWVEWARAGAARTRAGLGVLLVASGALAAAALHGVLASP